MPLSLLSLQINEEENSKGNLNVWLGNFARKGKKMEIWIFRNGSTGYVQKK